MNQKILRYINHEGYCCPWAFFESHRATYTSTIYEAMEKVHVCTLRALQQQRASYRQGRTKCEHLANCLKAKLKAART